MDLALKIISFIIFNAYFLIQSKSDVKEMKVYVILNDVMMGIFGGYFLIRSFLFSTIQGGILGMDFETCIYLIILFLLGIFHVFGMGDLKAYVAIYASTAFYCIPGMLRTNAFLIGCLIGCMGALFWQTVIKKNKVTDKKRFAFFPFLYLNYLITTGICFFTNI